METINEIEFKLLITKELLNQIKEDYKNCILKEYSQTNYYITHPILEKNKYMLRMREKEKNYELTLKRPSDVGLLESNIQLTYEQFLSLKNKDYFDNDIFSLLKDLHINLNELNQDLSMTTYRVDIQMKTGILSLDESHYLGITDYEMELEVEDYHLGLIEFKDLMQHYQLTYISNTPSKIKRLLKRKSRN